VLLFDAVQILFRSSARLVSNLGIECGVPLGLLDAVYGNASTPSAEACEPHPLAPIDFRLLLATPAELRHVLSGSLTGSVVLSATYTLLHCNEDAQCQHGGVCWKGSCQCAFGWCGAFCNSPADNVCSLPTQVRTLFLCACVLPVG
jgi:hypothetical protein